MLCEQSYKRVAVSQGLRAQQRADIFFIVDSWAVEVVIFTAGGIT
jgi:hypothetical protein